MRVGLITGGIFLNGCYKRLKAKSYDIPGKLSGPNEKAGHLLRDKISFPKPLEHSKVKILIIGSGISGLSAGRWLKQSGETDFEILELEAHKGGNAHSGKNKDAAYPLGAHYVTVANNEDEVLMDFFKEINVITHMEKGLPYYNEFYLTFDPEERLLINGEWQEGLVPEFGVPELEKTQIKRFLAEVEELRLKKGADGKFVFNVPVSESSSDKSYLKLDLMSFKDYLDKKGFTSKYLLWYLNYACKDDYGRKISDVSAWAGLHYFASRRGLAANAERNAVLTWPQGNGWLMEQLADPLDKYIRTSSMCYQLGYTDNGKVLALVYDVNTQQNRTIEAEKVILCAPQYVNNRLLRGIKRPGVDYKELQYAPWLVANIKVSALSGGRGMGLCWDNVAYDTPSVGYVNSGQQRLNTAEDGHTLTYYLPLCDFEPAVARLAAYSRSYEQWLDIIMPELEYIHPGLTKVITNIDLWVWGHGMISPSVDLIWGDNLQQARKAIDQKIFFAHSDLSGISIFEEAFHQGIRAAKEVLKNNG